jgi:predicted transcriptional regulator
MGEGQDFIAPPSIVMYAGYESGRIQEFHCFKGPARALLLEKHTIQRGLVMAKVKINVKTMVADIRGGMKDTQLIEKHGLTKETLPKVIDQLVQNNYISDKELQDRPVFESTQDIVDLFSFSYPDSE